jgi:putative flippase GtrA
MRFDSLKACFDRLLKQQFLKYLVVGGTSWVVDLLVFYLTYPLLGIIAAQTAARLVGALVAFIGHKVIVFEDQTFERKTLQQQLLHYLMLWIVSYSLSIILLLLLIDLLQFHPMAAKLFTETIIIAINFLAMRRYIFAS